MPVFLLVSGVLTLVLHLMGFEPLADASLQEEYYNNFGKLHKAAILASLRPHLWTTDAAKEGKIYQEMKKRVSYQEHFVDRYFLRGSTVLDIGCGFGRQAYLLAMKGFRVFGIDTSRTFVNIARDLFAKHQLPGEFASTDILKSSLADAYNNVLLFDVLEHIIPYKRKRFARKVFNATQPGGILLMSLPHGAGGTTWKKKLKQYFSYFTNKEEHPYVIPQKPDVDRIFKNLFTVVDSLSTPETDYYVLKRC